MKYDQEVKVKVGQLSLWRAALNIVSSCLADTERGETAEDLDQIVYEMDDLLPEDEDE